MFNTNFTNISVILWWPVSLVEETGVPGKNHWPAASTWQTLSDDVVSNTPRQCEGFKLTMLAVIATDCIGSCNSNYHAIMTTAPKRGVRGHYTPVTYLTQYLVHWKFNYQPSKQTIFCSWINSAILIWYGSCNCLL